MIIMIAERLCIDIEIVRRGPCPADESLSPCVGTDLVWIIARHFPPHSKFSFIQAIPSLFSCQKSSRSSARGILRVAALDNLAASM